MEETNKKYTAKDFARYHSGTMPVNEMHALEKAALEDPFLADALEGYLNTTNFESDIIELKTRLEEKRKKGNVFSITLFTQNNWWRIAVLFIIIAGAAYFFFQTNNVPKENSLAKNKIKTSADKQESAAPIINDSTVAIGDVALERQEAFQSSPKEKTTFPKQNNRSKKESYAPDPKSQSKAVAGLLSKSKDASVADNISMNAEDKAHEKEQAKEYLLKGKVTDEKGKPIVLASITDPTRKEATLTDTTGNFLLRSADSNTTAIINAVGYSTKKITLQKDKQATIEMNKNDANLNEVVITSANQKREEKQILSASKAMNGKIAGVEITKPGIEPFAKNDAFKEYLKNNIKPIFDTNGEQVTGEILLSFRIDKKGRPVNIKVVKSSCEACEEEAVRLLKNGPDWSTESNKQKKLVIKF